MAVDMASLQEAKDSKEEAYNRNLRDMEGDFREYAPLMNRVVSLVEMHSSRQLDDADMVINDPYICRPLIHPFPTCFPTVV